MALLTLPSWLVKTASVFILQLPYLPPAAVILPAEGADLRRYCVAPACQVYEKLKRQQCVVAKLMFHHHSITERASECMLQPF